MNHDDLLNADQLAPTLHMHPTSLRRLARTGKIPFYEIGGAIRFDRDEVLEATRRPAYLQALKEMNQ